MKKLLSIVLSILIIVFLTGCVNNAGIFISILPNFILPDDQEFVNLVEELQTPEEICEYMEDNFEYEDNFSNLSPYELYQTEKGNCDDFSIFAVFIANYHGCESHQILIEFPPQIYGYTRYHMIGVFKEGDYYNISENTLYVQCFCKDFREIMNFYLYRGWISYVVYDYDMNIVESVKL